MRRTRHVGHGSRSKQLMSDFLLWTFSHGRSTRTYVQLHCTDNGYRLGDLPGAMDEWMNRMDGESQENLCLMMMVYIRGAFNKFPDFFVQALNIVVDSWKFNMLLQYILWDDWPIFMISGPNEQRQQQLENILLILKMQSGREGERYARKCCFKVGKKMTQKRLECFRLRLEHLAWIEH